MGTLSKSTVKEFWLSKWFDSRKKAAIEDYRSIVENSPYKNYCIAYRGQTFNPLELMPRVIKGIHEVSADSPYASKLDRFIRIHEDYMKVSGILTYILNYVDDGLSFKYVVFSEGIPSNISELDNFKEEIQDKLSYLKRIRLLADMV